MVLLMITPLAWADFLVRNDGTVIFIPEGGNACAYHPQYNPNGFDENGKFPTIVIGLAIKEKLDSCTAPSEDDDFPTLEECSGLVLSPNIRDPRCVAYD